MLFPVPADTLLHELVNHSTTAPVPAVPPDTDSTVLPPLQMVVVPLIPVGATDGWFTVTITDAQVVALQSPL